MKQQNYLLIKKIKQSMQISDKYLLNLNPYVHAGCICNLEPQIHNLYLLKDKVFFIMLR